MAALGIHRAIEQHAASHPDATALADGDRSLTYRELSRRANVVARRLIDRGFRRGGHAVVNGERSLELAVVLLGVLKAGGAYTWVEVDGVWPPGVSILKHDGAMHDGAEQQWQTVDVLPVAAEPAPLCPNLPIVTRAGDVACVLRGVAGEAEVLVPHEAITSLRDRPVGPVATWGHEPGALDLWLTLMAGATAVVAATPLAA